MEQAIKPDYTGPDSAVTRVLREHLAPTAAPDSWIVLRAARGEAEPLAAFVPEEIWPGRAVHGVARPRDQRERGLPAVGTQTMLVRIRVGPDGRPTTVFLLNSSGNRREDAVIVEEGRKLHFQPAVKDGGPVPTWVTLPVNVAAHS